jgi:hypothetical protein
MTALTDIPLADIRLTGEGWDRYVFNAVPRVTALVESISLVGINTPLAVVKADDGCTLVCGYARALAAKMTGREGVPAFVIGAGRMSEEQLLDLSVEDNRFTRPFHYFDAARIFLAYRDRCGFDDSRLAREIAPRIGVSSGERVVARYLSLNKLGEGLRRVLAEGGLSFAHAVLLADFAGADAEAVARLFLRVGANANEAREIAEIVRDLGRIRKCAATGIIALPEIAQARKEELRKKLRAMRYPALAAAEETFEKLVGELRLDTNVAVSHSPNFETDLMRINITARSAEELASTLSKLNSALASGLISKIFSLPKSAAKGV